MSFGKKSRIKNIVWLAGCGLLMLTACEKACKKAEEQPVHEKDAEAKPENAAAEVNGVRIPKDELEVLHKRAVEKFARTNRQVSADLDRKMRASILRKMIDDEVIKQKAEKEGVKVDRIERVEGLEHYKQKMGGPKAFVLFMEQQGLTEEQVQQTVLGDLQRDKLIQKLGQLEEPTEAEIKEHFQANQRLYSMPEMVRARHLLLKLSENDSKEKADLVLKKAHEILKEAQSGNVSFETLVNKYSEGGSAKQGGDLGFFGRGRMVKNFEDAAFDAPPKKAVGPIKTEFGYHIIYVEEKTPSKVASLDQVRDRVKDFIKRSKRSRKSEELLLTLRKEAKIKVYDYSMTQDEYAGRAPDEKVAAQGEGSKN
jgi:peptidyl-prolyl cis-trans isomerase C